MAEHLTIFEVGPRDGLQNEARAIATADKIRLVDALSACGLRRIEVTSFVNPRLVPQMADAAEVMAGISRAPGTTYAALTPNQRGAEAAIASRANEIAVVAAASETFSQRNINCSIAESLARFAPVAGLASAAGIPLRGYVSCVTDCPYEGGVDPEAVARVAAELLALGCHEIALGETLGRGTPDQVDAMLQAVVAVVPPAQLAGHFHDTAGRALDNIGVALRHGLRVFDAAAGGLGGCPFAPGAAGNVATERVEAFARAQGFQTGIDPAALAAAAGFAQSLRRAG